MSEEHDPWHLDKRVPLALIFAILLQTVGIVWWAASIDARQTAQNDRIGRNTLRITRAWDKMNADGERVTNTAERVAKMEGTLEHIARQIDRVLNRMDKRK